MNGMAKIKNIIKLTVRILGFTRRRRDNQAVFA